MNQSKTERKRNIVAFAAFFLAMILFAGSTPVQAQSKGGPDGFIVKCKYKGKPHDSKPVQPQQIRIIIANCQASGGKVAGVTPYYGPIKHDPPSKDDDPKDDGGGAVKNPKDATKG